MSQGPQTKHLKTSRSTKQDNERKICKPNRLTDVHSYTSITEHHNNAKRSGNSHK